MGAYAALQPSAPYHLLLLLIAAAVTAACLLPALLPLLFAAHSRVIGVACCSATKSAVATFSCCRKSIKFFVVVASLSAFHFSLSASDADCLFPTTNTYRHICSENCFERVASTCRNLPICTDNCVQHSLIYGSHMIY